jgi:hypothetical protein
MKKYILVLLFFLFFSAQNASAECINGGLEGTSSDGCPKDVVAFADRFNSCGHFEGEAYSSEEKKGLDEVGLLRAKFLDDTVKELKCNRLEKDRKKLKLKYKNNKQVFDFIGRFDQ